MLLKHFPSTGGDVPVEGDGPSWIQNNQTSFSFDMASFDSSEEDPALVGVLDLNDLGAYLPEKLSTRVFLELYTFPNPGILSMSNPMLNRELIIGFKPKSSKTSIGNYIHERKVNLVFCNLDLGPDEESA